MSNMLVFQIFELFVVAFGIFIVHQYISIFFKRKCDLYYLIIGYLVFGLGSGFLSLFYSHHIHILLAYTVTGIFAVEFFLYTGNKTSKTFVALFFGVIVIATEVIFAGVYLKLSGINMGNAHEYSLERVLIVTMLSLTQLFVVKMIGIAVRWNKKEKDKISLKDVIALLIAQLFSMALLHIVFTTTFRTEGKVSLSIILFAVAIVYINFLMFWHYERIKFVYKYEHEKEIMEAQIKFQKKYYEQLELQQHKTEALWHDMQKHILAIKEFYHMGMKSDAEKYISSIERSLHQLPRTIRTGVPAINAILADELRKAEEHNIEVRLDINMPHGVNINPFDLCVIIGNTVENAIDACIVLPEGNKRYIYIKVLQDDCILLIEIENPYNITAKSASRSGRKNGYGLKNVYNTVKEHNGNIEIKNAGGIYRISLMIPCVF